MKSIIEKIDMIIDMLFTEGKYIGKGMSNFADSELDWLLDIISKYGTGTTIKKKSELPNLSIQAALDTIQYHLKSGKAKKRDKLISKQVIGVLKNLKK